jgi:hypothetical protein
MIARYGSDPGHELGAGVANVGERRAPFGGRVPRKECEVDKQRERATVEAFLLSQGYPTSALKEWDRERPDALVQLGDTIVGIEVTTLVEATARQVTPPQKWTTEASRVVRFAQQEFERRHSLALVVSVVFRPDWKPNKREATTLGSDIAVVIEERALPRVPHADRPFEVIQLKEPHSAVAWIYVGHTRQSLGGRWVPSFGGTTRYATAEDIAETVRRKEADVHVYRRAAPVVWLLIDCDLVGQGIFTDVPDLRRDLSVSSGFDRVFCCGFGMWKWVEISCCRSTCESV